MATVTYPDRASRNSPKSDCVLLYLAIYQLILVLQFASNVDFKQTYLWGVEWWYLRHLEGDSEYWDLGKELFEE